jgi:hypothetical protein
LTWYIMSEGSIDLLTFANFYMYLFMSLDISYWCFNCIILNIRLYVSPFSHLSQRLYQLQHPFGTHVQSSSPFATWCLDTKNERHLLPSESTIHLYPSFLIVKHWVNVLLDPHTHIFHIVLVWLVCSWIDY